MNNNVFVFFCLDSCFSADFIGIEGAKFVGVCLYDLISNQEEYLQILSPAQP